MMHYTNTPAARQENIESNDTYRHTIRHGLIKADIWSYDTDRGRYYRFTLERLYQQDQSWKSSVSFSRQDLRDIKRVLTLAKQWIKDAEAEDFRQFA